MAVPDDIAAALAVPGKVPSTFTAQYLAESRDHGPIVGILFVAILTLVVVLMRAYARLVLVKKPGLDDALLLFSLLLFISFVVLSLVLIRLGSGRHMEYIQYVLSEPAVNQTEVLDYVAHLIYTAALFVCRLSGLAFYARLCDRHRKLLIVVRCAAVFLIVAFLPQFFLILLHCKPVTGLWPYAWQAESPNYQCLSWGIVYSVNSGLSLVCDVVLFVIPTAIIAVYRASVKRKIQLSLILFPGVIVIGISITRLYLVIQGQWVTDGSWYYSPMLAVETSEVGGTMIALSVPALKPLFGSWLPMLSGSFWTATGGKRFSSFGKSGSRNIARSDPSERRSSNVPGRSHGYEPTGSDDGLPERTNRATLPEDQIQKETEISVETTDIPLKPVANW